MSSKQQLIIGISGASGAIYGIRLLEILKDSPIHTHLVISKAARITIKQETGHSVSEIESLADTVHPIEDIGATISSGSFQTLGMIVAPCSIKTASEIACGTTSNLLTRAADVVLKEQRKLVLAVRESPLHLGHLRTLTHLSEIGATIAPPLPAFYPNPETIDDLVNHSVGRLLDLFAIEHDVVKRWQGLK